MSKIKGNNIEIENALSINGIPINLLGGSGSGEAQSYITTGRSAESVGDLSAWTIYSNTPGVNPVNGFGGSPNITLTRNTTNPLSGLGDFRITKDAVNRQGQGISIPFTVDNRHLARVLQISFDYETISGILGQDNVRVSIIGDPNGTPFLIEPVNTSIEFPTIGNRSKHIATFQTNFSVKEYRLCIHISSTTTEAFVISFNNFRVWEQDQNYGAIITDWVSYTPTFTNMGTSPSSDLIWRRNGSNLEIKGRMTLGSAVPNSVGSITLPGVSAVNTGSFSSVQAIGLCIRANAADHQCNVLTNPSSPNLLNFSSGDGTANALTPQNTSSIVNSGEAISFNVSVPIQGWGSNMALSSNASDGRLVSGSYLGHTSFAYTADVTKIKYNTIQKDSHACYNTSTGELTIPISGDYIIGFSQMNSAGSNINLKVFKNNVYTTIEIGQMNSVYTSSPSVKLDNLRAGDIIDVRPHISATIPSLANSVFWFTRISAGSQLIAPVETVACSYYSSATQTSLTTQINFGTRVYDTHGAVTTGAGWKFTPPMAGKYRISGFFSGSATNLYLKLYKTGISYATICHVTDGTESYSIEVDLLSTDFIDIRPSGSLIVNGHANYNNDLASRIEISRIGI